MRLTPVCRELPFSRALSLPGGHWGPDRRPGDTPQALPLRPSLLCSAGLLKKLVEIFQQTSLGRFLAQLSAEQQEELFLCYIKDFLLLTMRVSTWEELRVSAHSGAGEGATGVRAAGPHRPSTLSPLSGAPCITGFPFTQGRPPVSL